MIPSGIVWLPLTNVETSYSLIKNLLSSDAEDGVQSVFSQHGDSECAESFAENKMVLGGACGLKGLWALLLSTSPTKSYRTRFQHENRPMLSVCFQCEEKQTDNIEEMGLNMNSNMTFMTWNHHSGKEKTINHCTQSVCCKLDFRQYNQDWIA